MKKYIVTFIVLFLTSFGFASEAAKNLTGKKILMIIAREDFNDDEYQKPKQLFETFGIIITTASSSLKTSKSMSGLEVKPDILMERVNVNEFDGIVFVGGNGVQKYWDNKLAQNIAREAVKQNKVLGAISQAPVILARAGVIKNKRVTSLGSTKDEIIAGGGQYIGSLVEIDRNIITANGPQASEIFAKDIVEALLKK